MDKPYWFVSFILIPIYLLQKLNMSGVEDDLDLDVDDEKDGGQSY